MIKKIAAGCLLVVAAAIASAPEVMAADEPSEISFSAGYRQDSLDWNINGEGNPVGSSPNILSELTWRDLKIFQVKTEMAGSNAHRIYFRGSANYGWVIDGENQDSDYAGDNRTLEFSRSINSVNGSKVMGLKGGVGYEYPFGAHSEHSFVPLVGYSYHSQQMNMTDGNQKLSNYANLLIYDPSATGVPPLGSFPGLKSSYDATWSGLWLGADTRLDLQANGLAFLHLEVHFPKYTARANWNLRDDFDHPVSFEHDANGRGWVIEMGWHNQLSHYQWELGVSLTLQRWVTDSGVDRAYYSDNTYSEGVLNEVNWSSSTLNVTVSKNLHL